jgi:hypothetical protein
VNDSIIFTISRKSSCENSDVASSRDTVEFRPSSGTCSFKSEISNPYDFLSPAFTVVPPTSITEASLNQLETREIKIINGGNGSTDTVFFYVIYQDTAVENSTALNTIKVGAIDFPPYRINADTLFYKIYGSTLFGGDASFSNSESITILEPIIILKCGSLSNVTKYNASWGVNANMICENEQATSGVISMNNNLPKLNVTLENTDIYDFCYIGDSKTVVLKIKNTGNGSATNLDLLIRNQIPGSTLSPLRIDTAGGFIVKNKDGIQIGVLNVSVNGFASNYPNAIISTGPGSCNTPPYIFSVSGKSNSIVIPAHDSIYVEVKMASLNFGCTGTCSSSDLYSWVAMQTQVTYKNQCASATYTEDIKTIATRYYAFYRYTVEHVTDIVGYGTDNKFDYNIDLTNLQTFGNPDNTGEFYIGIDVKSSGITPTITSIDILGDSYPVQYFTDSIILIGPLNNNRVYNVAGQKLVIPMEASCSKGGGMKSLRHFFYLKYSSCAPWISIACKQTSIFIHCALPCPKGGATPQKFTLKRITYGLKDADNNGIPDDGITKASASEIEDHRSVNGDTLLATWNVKVTQNTDVSDTNVGRNFRYVYFNFKLTGNELSLNSNGSVNIAGPGVATIYPKVGSPISCTVTPTLSTVASVGIYAHYELDNLCRGSSWLDGDSIVFEAKYTTVCYNSDNFSKGVHAGFRNFITKNEVYASYERLTNTYEVPNEGLLYTCFTYNDYNTMNYIWLSPYISTDQVIKGCTGRVLSNIRQYTRYQEGSNSFPNEYRNFFTPSIMKILIPKGYIHRLGSARLIDNPVSGRAAMSDAVIADADISKVNDTLFVDVSKIFTTSGGTWTPPDEHSQYTVSILLDPTCESASGTFASATNTNGVGNGINTPNIYNAYLSPTTTFNGSVANVGYTVTTPQLNLQGGGIYTSPNASGKWNIQIQNQSNVASASNVWVYISPKNSLTDIVLTDGTTTYLPDANGFYQLGNMLESSIRNLVVTSKIGACTKDSMLINVGFSCSSYPTTFISESCIITKWLIIENTSSQIQLSVLQQPGHATSGVIPLCSIDSTVLLINSALAGNIKNPYITFNPPVGLSLSGTTVSVEYPLGSGNIQLANTISLPGGGYRVNLNEHTLISDSNIKGTLSSNSTLYPTGQDRQAKITLKFSTNCDFVSGSPLVFNGYASRPCGLPAIGNGIYTITNSLNIDGVTPLGNASLNFDIGSSPSTTCNSALNIKSILTAFDFTTSATDTVIYMIPTAMQYAGNLTSGFTGSVSGGGLFPTILKIAVPAGISSGTPINYGFDVLANSQGCDSGSITGSLQRMGEVLNCSGTSCPSASRVIIASNTSPKIEIKKPSLSIVKMEKLDDSAKWVAGTHINRVKMVYRNEGTLNYVSGSDSVEFFCTSAGSVPFYKTSITKSILVGASDSEVYDIIIPVSSCAAGNFVESRIPTETSSGTTQCMCSPSSLLASAALPIGMLSYEANSKSCVVSINWMFSSSISSQLSTISVERSNDGKQYSTLAVLNGSETHYTDVTPSLGTWLYRLRIESKEGKVNYSPVKVMTTENCKDFEVLIYPNPASEQLNITLQGSSKVQSYELLDVVGKKIRSGNLESSSNNVLDVSQLSKGSYIIKLTIDGTTTNQQIQLTKQ